MLRTSRGGVFSKHKQRAARGLDTEYSDTADDLGNVAEYGEFVAALARVFAGLARCTKAGKYLVVVAQNLRDPSGEVRPLAWDLAKRLGKSRWQFQGERIWCQNTKPLGIWGYPKNLRAELPSSLLFDLSEEGRRSAKDAEKDTQRGEC